jgi:hypothetical protein
MSTPSIGAQKLIERIDDDETESLVALRPSVSTEIDRSGCEKHQTCGKIGIPPSIDTQYQHAESFPRSVPRQAFTLR